MTSVQVWPAASEKEKIQTADCQPIRGYAFLRNSAPSGGNVSRKEYGRP